MKKIIIIVSLLFLSIVSFSQKADSLYILPKYSIGISPSALLNIYRGVQLSQDFRITKKINFTLETAYIYSNALYVHRDVAGIRIKTGIELLVFDNRETAVSLGFFYLKRYIEEDFKLNVKYRLYRYERKLYVKRVKDLEGVGVNLDFRQKIDQRFHLGLGLGFGLGRLSVDDKYKYRDRKSENLIFRGWLAYDSVGLYILPIVSFNFNISYAIFR